MLSGNMSLLVILYSLLSDLVMGLDVVALLNLLLLMDDLISIVRLQSTFVEQVVCRQMKDKSEHSQQRTRREGCWQLTIEAMSDSCT